MRNCIECGSPLIQQPPHHRQCKKCWAIARRKEELAEAYARGYRDGKASGKPIEAARIRQLIQLCHPDRHDGSKTANDVTAWLCELRRTQ